jgi:hypothetical protein
MYHARVFVIFLCSSIVYCVMVVFFLWLLWLLCSSRVDVLYSMHVLCSTLLFREDVE